MTAGERRAARGAAGDGGAPPLAEAMTLAAHAWAEFRGGKSLDRALDAAAHVHGAKLHPRAPAAARDLAYQATRRLALVDALLAQLAARKPAPLVGALVGVALAQLLADRHAAYTVVDQAVEAAKRMPAARGAQGFVNGVLRAFLRQGADVVERLRADESIRYNAPAWWIERLRAAWPDDWRTILDAQQAPPPLVLRVNTRRVGVDAYLARLAAAGCDATRVGAAAIWLHVPRPVESIPGFADGDVSVQDAGAQLAAPWLLGDGDAARLRVLDACAAPGGKTAHLAELGATSIDAVERDAARARRIDETLARLRLADRARVHVADVAEFARDAGPNAYDRVLLDAPCTASGIVRRHPDIPWLRRPADVVQLATEQARLLDALWPCVAPAGRLLYVVCSVFPEECTHQVERFVRRFRDARPVALPGMQATQQTLLPTAPVEPGARAWTGGSRPSQHDGFFYALFEKS